MRRRPPLPAVLALVLAVALTLVGAPAGAVDAQTDRHAGADRYGTAAQVSVASATVPAPRVFIANGRAFPDGLSGGAAAAHDGSPLLLVETGRMPGPTAAELIRLRPREIIVLGGDQAVGPAVVRALERHAPVTRWSGADRYGTSAAISRNSTAAGVGTVYIASGEVYADGVTGAAVAGAARSSVLLVRSTTLPAPVRTELARLRPSRIVVLGGTTRVGPAVVTELGRYADSVVRVAGDDRYETSARLSQRAYPRGAGTVYLASGQDFPDALAGAPAARIADAPILLVHPVRIHQAIRTELRRLAPDRVVALGGPDAVGADVLREAGALAAAGVLHAGDGNQILAAPSASLSHLQRRAREMGANTLFVEQMTPALYRAALRYEIDPTVMVAQSFHETGGGHFGRAVTPAHRNTCGLKVRNPVGPDDNPDDHARFPSWDAGATAHAQHLYAYTGTSLPAGEVNIDPRWDWVYGLHQVTTMTGLSGKWAPSPNYGNLVRGVATRLLADN